MESQAPDPRTVANTMESQATDYYRNTYVCFMGVARIVVVMCQINMRMRNKLEAVTDRAMNYKPYPSNIKMK